MFRILHGFYPYLLNCQWARLVETKSQAVWVWPLVPDDWVASSDWSPSPLHYYCNGPASATAPRHPARSLLSSYEQSSPVWRVMSWSRYSDLMSGKLYTSTRSFVFNWDYQILMILTKRMFLSKCLCTIGLDFLRNSVSVNADKVWY